MEMLIQATVISYNFNNPFDIYPAQIKEIMTEIPGRSFTEYFRVSCSCIICPGNGVLIPQPFFNNHASCDTVHV